jgi:hypothetical protein
MVRIETASSRPVDELCLGSAAFDLQSPLTGSGLGTGHRDLLVGRPDHRLGRLWIVRGQPLQIAQGREDGLAAVGIGADFGPAQRAGVEAIKDARAVEAGGAGRAVDGPDDGGDLGAHAVRLARAHRRGVGALHHQPGQVRAHPSQRVQRAVGRPNGQ